MSGSLLDCNFTGGWCCIQSAGWKLRCRGRMIPTKLRQMECLIEVGIGSHIRIRYFPAVVLDWGTVCRCWSGALYYGSRTGPGNDSFVAMRAVYACYAVPL